MSDTKNIYFVYHPYEKDMGVRETELKRLRYFVTVADEGSISAAARKLYMSQPPLSTQLRLLEEEVGCPLLARGARSVELTEAGKRLYARARTLLELEQTAREEARACGLPQGGTVRLGVVSSVAGTLLPRWLGGFLTENPDVQVRLVEADTFGLLARLREGHLQAAILRTPCPDEGLMKEPLTEEALVAAAPSLPEDTTLPALAGQPLLLYRRWEDYLRAHFERAGVPFSPRCVCDDARTTVALARQGLGIALVPESALVGSGLASRPLEDARARSGIELVWRADPSLPEPTRRLFAYWRKNRDLFTKN